MIADLQRELAVSNAERDAALAREAAMAEVLQVINSSPGDLAPVFDTMLEKATRLCEAPCAMLWTYDENKFAVAATFGVTPAFAEFMRPPLPIQPSIFLGAIQRGEAFVQQHRPRRYRDQAGPIRGRVRGFRPLRVERS
jgi:hypothetical protein